MSHQKRKHQKTGPRTITKDQLSEAGIPKGQALNETRKAVRKAMRFGHSEEDIRTVVQKLLDCPAELTKNKWFKKAARIMVNLEEKPEEARPVETALREEGAPYRTWGSMIEAEAIRQMDNACMLPISVEGALMPDAHLGYGLPIGGVLATEGSVIPFAVGMDIACRMKMSVLDFPISELEDKRDLLKRSIHRETRFGVGAEYIGRDRKSHRVMDMDWSFGRFVASLKDKAWKQLGTSGSGNHFVEFGELEVQKEIMGLSPGTYLALLSHSGSRGSGAEIAQHYSRLAKNICTGLPAQLSKLAWLDLSREAGQEYWQAMELMGSYASANHELIHRGILDFLGAATLLDLENHHNFAWKETYEGKELIVHRKGATPAHNDAYGIIPGSMATPGFVVRGRGNRQSINSAAHGAGRRMSRKAAKKTYNWSDAQSIIKEGRVEIISAGLDEVPMAYKEILSVMEAQKDLVEIMARFDPKIVKMAPA